MTRALAAVVLTLCCLATAVSASPADAARATAAQHHACLRKASQATARSARARARARAHGRCRRQAAKAPVRVPGTSAPAPGTAPVTVPPAPSFPSAPVGAPRTPGAPAAPAPAPSALQAGVVDCANRERAKAGLPALAVDAALTRAAQAHAADMATRNYFDHYTPEGLSPWDRIAAALQGERPFQTMGENIAEGFATAEDTCVGWMNSAGHRANILNPDFTRIGGGWADGYAVQDFGA